MTMPDGPPGADDLAPHALLNGRGMWTTLGAGRSEAVIGRAMARALGGHYVMETLHDTAGALVANACGVEAAYVVGCAAGALAIGAAAMLAGSDADHIRRLPDTTGLERTAIVLAGPHDVDFGGRVSQMLALSGARVVRAGSAIACDDTTLAAALDDPRVAGLMFIVTNEMVADLAPGLPAAIAAARRRGVPILVDIAAQDGPERFAPLDADALILSAQKVAAGPTAGIILGRAAFVSACRAQSPGIGRAMKASKEAVVGATVAITHFTARGAAAWRAAEHRRAVRLLELLRLAGLDTTLHTFAPPVHTLVVRLRLPNAADFADRLEGEAPPIFLRRTREGEGIIDISVTTLREDELEPLASRIARAMSQPTDRDPS